MIYLLFTVSVLLGHYTFSIQRTTYKLAQEFRTSQSDFDPLLPGWFLPLQILSSICKFAILGYVAFFIDNIGLAVGLFAISAVVHIAMPLFPASLFFRTFYEKAKYIQEVVDYNAGSQYLSVLNSSRLF